MNPHTQRVLEVARGQLNVKEKPRNSNSVKYNRAYYKSDVRLPWCVVFQWWCFQQAGLSTQVFPKSNSVKAVKAWFKEKHQFDQKPRVGSLVIFTFSHIGIVEKILPGGRIQTIEGNTDAHGSRTGGVVMRKIRSRSIAGYCHPDYAKSGTKVVNPAKDKPVVKPAAPSLDSVYTAVFARQVRVPARKFKSIQFTNAQANEGEFWTPPKDGKGGFAVARGAGAFVADVTLDLTGLKPGTSVIYRLVETDAKKGFERIQATAPTELRVTSAGTTRRHAATTSRLGAGHLWVQIYSREAITLPLVKAEVLFIRERR